MKCRSYFENPTQVIFFDPIGPKDWCVGIAYHDKIICACHGSVFNINNIIAMGTKKKDIRCYIYENRHIWNNISDAIVNNALPRGLTFDKNGEICEIHDNDLSLLEEEIKTVFTNGYVD